MKRGIYIMLLGLALMWTSKSLKAQESIDFNFDWEFILSQDSLTGRDYQAMVNTKDWEQVRLPHDWVIKGSFDSTLVNTAPATGYIYGGGLGWYKKTFDLDLNDTQEAFILFDGVYNNSDVWINGQHLGFHPYGYSPFFYDLTPHLNKNGNDNVIVVRIDHTRYADSRWYTGAGIYRNVSLVVKNKVDIPIWGTFVTTPKVSAERAEVSVQSTIVNHFKKSHKGSLETQIVAPNGTIVATSETKYDLEEGQEKTLVQTFEINNPVLWGIFDPNLYQAVTTVTCKKLKNTTTTTFGIRDFNFDPNTGFSINGENYKIKGVCLHHDAGLVGTAVPKGVWRRRLEILKEGGTNAIRIAHNPGSNEFLDLCDEMGFLVQDEFFDEWDNPKDKRLNQNEQHDDYESRGYAEHFQKWAEKDLKSVILSHRNHPSIIQWSIGNEIEWTYPRNANATGYFNNMNWNGNYFWQPPPFSTDEIKKQLATLPKAKYDMATTAKKLAGWTKEMDTTRPVIANSILPSASHLSGVGDVLDIMGYSYRRVLYDYGHKNYPNQVIMGTENLAQYHEWKAIMERPFIAGTFLWTGIDYMGEIRGPWPTKGTLSGLLDYAGFKKSSFFMMKSLWQEEPSIHIATQTLPQSINRIDEQSGQLVAQDAEAWKTALWEWHEVNNHWNYKVGEVISIEMYSNCEEIELFLNGESQGKRSLNEFEDHIYKWGVAFQPGELKAVGSLKSKIIEEVLYTTTEPVAIQLTVDQHGLKADAYDVAHIVAQLVDAQGHPVKTQEAKIKFEIEGQLRMLGIDNGAGDNVQDHYASEIVTDQGRALFIVQSLKETGKAVVSVASEALESNKIIIEIE
ncbi:glycoside hydrolase family 2 TIM barrel-domain containing protein [Reichenbachiella sp.]|uniref:glycoside hydrolase family 2 TIM barrel-domain containing protein n=1 Tax=Reichenbachiella sp. TaxID=2184521 RepID=UPI003BAE90DB